MNYLNFLFKRSSYHNTYLCYIGPHIHATNTAPTTRDIAPKDQIIATLIGRIPVEIQSDRVAQIRSEQTDASVLKRDGTDVVAVGDDQLGGDCNEKGKFER